MTDIVVYPAEKPLVGSVPVPGDKSIAHRALLLAGLASGKSSIRGGVLGDDNLATLAALNALGVRSSSETPGEILVEGAGMSGLREPGAPIDCRNSGTTMRLLAGILAAQRFPSRLVGDASLSTRPMERIARPLRLRGARIEGRLDPRKIGEITAPLDIGPLPSPQVLSEIEYELPVASAQVKSAILLSGLFAAGSTYIREPVVSRDHTERMLVALGVPIRSAGAMIELDAAAWSGSIEPFSVTIPGDLSAAAFLIAAAQIVPGSRVDVRRVGLNPTRTGILEVLRDMGGRIAFEMKDALLGEPMGDLFAGHAELRAGKIGGELVARAVDEVPILCALGARGKGITRIHDAEELRVKESDRLSAMAGVLRAFGVEVEETPDGMQIEGRPDEPLLAADVASQGDHRIAMAAAVLGLVARGPSRVRDAACIATSFPRFIGTLRALGARVEVVR
ncbi:MAG: 3-phosphoshikimate 1-carboxyvinyltransferase [Polyangiaceae bacterium]|nr:3-phosphoshikimate 1-carboxyvinyltransferase [Polyangiaceae bacterium]